MAKTTSSLRHLQMLADEAKAAVDAAKRELEDTISQQVEQEQETLAADNRSILENLCPSASSKDISLASCFLCATCTQENAPSDLPHHHTQSPRHQDHDAEALPWESSLNLCLRPIRERFKKRPKYPRKLLVTIIGASQLPKLHTFGWCDPYVVVENLQTSQKEQTFVMNNNADPIWEETFTIVISDLHDTLKMEIFNHDIIGADDPIGAVIFPLDPRFIANREVGLDILDRQRRRRGLLRVSATWEDELQPTRERGRFFYRVIFPDGILLRSTPNANSKKKGTSLRPGEVFEACERLKPVNENVNYVRINPKSDRWLRSGWVFERLHVYDESGKLIQELQVLEPIQPAKRTAGAYFYRVLAPVKLPLEDHHYSKMFSEQYVPGAILECSEKHTPAGSNTTYAKVDGDQGYVLENTMGDILLENAEGRLLEHCSCPKGTQVGDSEERIFYFKVVCEHGVYARNTPSPGGERDTRLLLKTGQVVVADKLLTMEFEGLGVFRFARVVKEGGDPLGFHHYWDPTLADRFVKHKNSEVICENFPWEGWVRLEKRGIQILTEIKDIKENGEYLYQVVHKGGVSVRKVPDTNAQPALGDIVNILECQEIFEVSQRCVKVEDLILSGPKYLKTDQGWVFDSKDGVTICEEYLPDEKLSPAKKSFRYLKGMIDEFKTP